MTITADLKDQALRVAGTVDPEVMTGVQAAEALEDLAVADKAVAGTLLFLALKVARTNAWQGQGFRSPADWLASKVGCSVAEAKRQLGTAEKAEDLPKTKEAIKNGDLSPDQADAVTDGASADPGAEEDLLASAAHDTHKDLRDKAAKARAAATSDEERERRIRRNRGIRRGTDREGAFWARFYGPGVSSALFEEMIRPFEELIFRQHRAAGIRSTYEQRSFDAFFAMLAFFQHLNATRATDIGEAAVDEARAQDGREPGPSRESGPSPELDPGERTHGAGDAGSDAGSTEAPSPSVAQPTGQEVHPPRGERNPPAGPEPPVWRPPWDPDTSIGIPAKLPGGNNVKVIVTVDHTALLRGHTEPGETCEIAGVGPISVDAARAILRDDPFLAVVVRKGQDIVNVAHHGRGLNAAQRTAIEAGGLHCTNISCNGTIAIQIDHRTPYATDPITELANADPLCTHDHLLKTHHGFALAAGTGRRRLLPPGHPDHPGTRPQLDGPANGGAVPGEARKLPPADPISGYDPATDTLPTGRALARLMDERELTDHESWILEGRALAYLAAKGIHHPRAADLRSTPTSPVNEQATLC
ncbi:MAG: DUF222 domain-containing protein [Aquihabitans sp.]